MGKTIIFIDGGYFSKVLQLNHDSPKIDLVKLSDIMSGGNELIKAYYYDCPPYQSTPPTIEQSERFSSKQKFFYAISQLPKFELRLGKLSPDFIQKRVDSMICVDIVRTALLKKATNISLFSGDSDLIPAIEVANEEKLITILWHGDFYNPKTAPSRELVQICSKHYYLSPRLVKKIHIPG